jgi:hypothetical protein
VRQYVVQRKGWIEAAGARFERSNNTANENRNRKAVEGLIMEKQNATDLTELGPKEATNQNNATKYLKASALLIGDIELLYVGIAPLVKFPGGNLDSPDQLALFVTLACNQLMMSRMLFTKSVIAALRMYQGDALTHLRRAIEACAFTVRMSKHRNLCKVWSEAGFDDHKYNAYRKAFRTEDVFPKKGHADFNPLLSVLKDRFDFASKQLHGSIYGMANYFKSGPKDRSTPNVRTINFFDMPPDSFPSTYFMILNTHLTILDLYGQILQPHTTEFAKWKSDDDAIKERVGRHVAKWMPTIMAWNTARNKKQPNYGSGATVRPKNVR